MLLVREGPLCWLMDEGLISGVFVVFPADGLFKTFLILNILKAI